MSGSTAVGSRYDLNFVTKPASELSKAEVDACYKLIRKIRFLYLAAGDRWDRQTKLQEMLDTPGLAYDLAYDDKGIVAFISYVLKDVDDHGSPTTFIYELHVASKWHGRGLGRHLLETVVAAAPATLTLRTFTCNRQAVAFYTALGFDVDTEISDDSILFMVK